MDDVLIRILSLIPRKPDGKFVHGSVKKFASELGLKSGNIVSDWIAGRSKSYEGYLYQIASIHNVSVEWLRGKTDDPTPPEQKESPPQSGELSMYYQLTPENRARADSYLAFLIAEQRKDQI